MPRHLAGMPLGLRPRGLAPATRHPTNPVPVRREAPGELEGAATQVRLCWREPPEQGTSGSDPASRLPPPAASSVGLVRDAPCGGAPRASPGGRARGSRQRPALPWLCSGSGGSWVRIPSLRGRPACTAKNPTPRRLSGFQRALRSGPQQSQSLQLSSESLLSDKLPLHRERPKFPLWQWNGISKLQLVPGLVF